MVNVRYRLSSMVVHARPATTASTASETRSRPAPAGVMSIGTRRGGWCTGEDSNLRSSKERQIYSLLPLTTRPPVPSSPPTPCDPKLTRCVQRRALRGSSAAKTRCSEERSGSCGQRRRTNLFRDVPHCGTARLPENWSWRRDLNPRPSDYKSDALPAELRQPKSNPDQPAAFVRRAPARRDSAAAITVA